jgi:hypothetical protein
MYRGLFWIPNEVRTITFKIQCDVNGTPVDADLNYNSRRGDSFTHKATWKEAAQNESRGIRSKPWNYFPRGRVEIKQGKATVYYNPTLGSPEFETKIREEFALADDLLTIRFVPDHSSHYKAAIC